MNPRGVDQQPMSAVEWVDPATLAVNSWNPNRQAPPESRLLKVSLIEDGWTAPIVAGVDNEIIDGYHRWLLGSGDRDVRALTEGLVPVVRLSVSAAHRRMSTIRHNRARGVHHVTGMADIVADLLDLGISPEEIERRLEMDEEEVGRLADRGVMTRRGAAASFGNGWTV